MVRNTPPTGAPVESFGIETTCSYVESTIFGLSVYAMRSMIPDSVERSGDVSRRIEVSVRNLVNVERDDEGVNRIDVTS